MDTQKAYPLTVYHTNKVSATQPIRVSATRSPVVRPAPSPVAIYTDVKRELHAHVPEHPLGASGAPMVFVYTTHETQAGTPANGVLLGVIAALIVAGALLFGAVIVAGAVVVGALAG